MTSIALKDGTLLSMRALGPDDKSLLQAFFGRLSPTSIHYQVVGGHGSLKAQELAYLMELDLTVHVALAATVVGDEGSERLVGVTRYIRIDAHGTQASTSRTAEVAFTVEDAFQLRGVFADGAFHVPFPTAATTAFLQASQARALSEVPKPADESKTAVAPLT